MGTQSVAYQSNLLNEDNETTPASPLRRLFSLKRGPSEKKKMIQNVLEKQESLSGKITELTEDRSSVLHELSTTNKCIMDLTTKVADLLTLNEHKKDYDNELKRQLKEGRNEKVTQADELRKSNKERHKFELEVCRLESLVRKLNNDLNNANKQKDNVEDSLVGYKKKITKMKAERSDLRLEVQRQQDIIRELSVDVQVLKAEISILKNENEDGEKRIEKMRGDRRKLLEYLRHKSEVYEDRLKLSWLEINGLKQERNQQKDKGPSTVVQLPSPAPFVLNNNETFLGMSPGPKWDRNGELERQKTRIMQLELQLYRREKLVEILVGKIKHHDRSFDLMADSSLLAYLDENWSLDVECSEFSEVSSTTWSQVSSVSSIDDQFFMLLK